MLAKMFDLVHAAVARNLLAKRAIGTASASDITAVPDKNPTADRTGSPANSDSAGLR